MLLFFEAWRGGLSGTHPRGIRGTSRGEGKVPRYPKIPVQVFIRHYLNCKMGHRTWRSKKKHPRPKMRLFLAGLTCQKMKENNVKTEESVGSKEVPITSENVTQMRTAGTRERTRVSSGSKHLRRYRCRSAN